MRSTLSRLRSAAGYRSAAAFSGAVGIPLPTLKRYESQPETIPRDRAELMADALGCTLDEVYGRAEPRSADPRAAGMSATYDALSERSRRDLADYAAYLRRRDERTGQVEREREEARWGGLESRYEGDFLSALVAGDLDAAEGTPREAFRAYVESREAGSEGSGLRVGKVMDAWDRRHGTVAAEYDRAGFERGGDALG